MDAIWNQLDPVIEHLKTCDLADPEATRLSLTEKFGDLPTLQAVCNEQVDDLCPREAGATKFGRLAKDRNGFSVDTVLSSGRGMPHRHPKGEVNFCFAYQGEPRFDGHEPGWVVYAPETSHPANVEGGAMFMIYFLPGGEIEWQRS
jgi:hypothetical protein